MRAVLQRVTSANVRVGGEVVAEITRPGLVALIGVTHDDDDATAAQLAKKIAELRIMADEKSVSDIGAPVLVISQFTLFAVTKKGRRPSWNLAAPGAVAEPLVAAVARGIVEFGVPVETGVFGAHMEVALVNDGPVTIILDTEQM